MMKSQNLGASLPPLINQTDGRVVVEARLPAQEVTLDRTAEAPLEIVLQ